MKNNPYQAPNQMPDRIDASEHKSFHLTQSSKANATSGRYRDALFFTLAQQIPLLMLSSMILDFGMILKRFVIASICFWIMTLIFRIRRNQSMTDLDILFVKWGYLPIALVTFIIWALVAPLYP